MLEVFALFLKDPEFPGAQVIVRQEAVRPTRLFFDRAPAGFDDQTVPAPALFSGKAVQIFEKGLGKVNANARHGWFLTEHVVPTGAGRGDVPRPAPRR
ncbi:MAG: hypothetical protein OXP70_15405 [Acidobacteriota bacterium]|nr:hypothetical protein [Acidobacteriota bacterium]